MSKGNVAKASTSPPKQATTWIILADDAVARIYEDAGCGTLHLITQFQSRAARGAERELGSDRPGRRVDRFGHRHALGGERDELKRNAATNLVREVGTYVNAAWRDRKFGSLTLIVPARVLGRIRKVLIPSCLASVERVIRKDLTHCGEAEVLAHLA